MNGARTRRGGDDFVRPRLFTIIGVAAIVVIAIVGWIAYNALKGLPLQSSYVVSVRLPDAQRLIETSDVRIAGVRVGQVDSVSASGSAPRSALVRLRLDPSVGRLSEDTRARVRPASVLGATYVALTPGRSRRTVPPGGALELRQTTTSVELTDFFGVFRGSAARNFRESVADFSGGLAGQGQALNAALAWLAQLMPPLTRVSTALAATTADLGGFIAGFDSLAGALGPVHEQLGAMVAGGARTFGALASEREAMAAAIDAAAPVEHAATVALRRARPGLRSLARLMVEARRATPHMAPAFRALDGAVAAGVAPLRRVPGFADGFRRAFATLEAIGRVPSTGGTIRKLGRLARAGSEALETMLPAQLGCNIFPLFMQAYASFLGVVGFDRGPSLGTLTVTNPGNATDVVQSREPARDAHINYTPRQDLTTCDAGNEPFTRGARKLGAPERPTGGRTLPSTPPPHVIDRARRAGLLAEVDG